MALGAGLGGLDLGHWEPRQVWAHPLAAPPRRRAPPPQHLAWVWQFSVDGPPERIRSVLATHGLGIALKTHDGTEWMARYDRSPHAVSGPGRIADLARYFEEGGVPFHAWCVVKGRDPQREAALAAAALAAGARSVILDLEPHAGFWEGTPTQALALGRELRRLAPEGWVQTSIDPRPWAAERTPLREFATFTDAWVPQVYWESFNTLSNLERFAATGQPPGSEGITPGFLLDVSVAILREYQLPIEPMGQGSSVSRAWDEFMGRALAHDMAAVSIWRFGVTRPEVWRLVRERPPRATEEVYVVQPGDTLSVLARRWNSTVSAIAEHNGIHNPDWIEVGQRLRVPGTRLVGGAPQGGQRVHVVQAGDTLSFLARRWRTSVGALAELNGLPNPNLIRIGQPLLMP